ncbi:GFA family protein [Rhodovulum sp. DZ06]|uniref:GFA family protein n=1 Tax=Rhodovulum sp. DZ06 TaxID=3425126 RepID=UPI003D331D41
MSDETGDGTNAGCLCGAVRMRIDGAPSRVVQCCCTDCQKSTGGGSVLVALAPRASVHIETGETRSYAVPGESGAGVTRHFCPQCGTPLFSELGKYPDLLALKAGVWDVDPGLKPSAVLWASSAAPWHVLPDDIPRFDRAAG